MSAPSLRSAALGAARAARRSLATSADIPQKSDPSLVPPFESRLLPNYARVREILGRPLSLAEKIVYSHLCDVEDLAQSGPLRGERYLKLRPDRVAMQDASAQTALLQFAVCGASSAAVPASVHCDHLISAFEGAEADLKRSKVSSKEIYEFLESAARKYGIAFWAPGAGIIHQVVLEQYSAPGLLMLGTDSHTPNAGGLGAIAIGVGGADAVDALSNTPWELKAPKLIGVELTGKLNGWTSPKDVCLHLAGLLTVRGGTGSIIEYFGPGAATLSATGSATICNMGAEVGATTSVFPYSQSMRSYLVATGRAHVARACDEAQHAGFLAADKGCEYDQHIQIDLSKLEPHLNGPHTPDLSTPLSGFKKVIEDNGWKDEISAALIGSCTNSSFEDMGRVASIARQARERGLKTATSFMITPGSELINATIQRDGITETLEQVGGTVLANACGPCIGQWDRREYKGEENAIVTSFNRNFRGRNDANRKTLNFLASPEIVMAKAFSGKLSFNPITDSLVGADGKPFKFDPPQGDELPPRGFTPGDPNFAVSGTMQPDPSVQIVISPDSTRLELLEPFEPHFSRAQIDDANASLELTNMRCLLRVRGKCTTDEISAAGKWLAYKGHLSNISLNTLIGATNDETGRINSAVDYADGSEASIPDVAKRYRDRGQPWLIVSDANYGEGSAREHAALQPRFLGAKVILARSLARIHQTNLLKQGIVPLTFANEADYSRIDAGDIVETVGLNAVLRGDVSAQVHVRVTKPDGSSSEIPVRHTISKDQTGSLQVIRQAAAIDAVEAGRGPQAQGC